MVVMSLLKESSIGQGMTCYPFPLASVYISGHVDAIMFLKWFINNC